MHGFFVCFWESNLQEEIIVYLKLLILLMQGNITSALSFDLIIWNSIGQELKNGFTAL
jgi:hypothetical protein